MSVRKTVTALVCKTLQKCNGHWRTRVYERKQQSVGILVTGRVETLYIVSVARGADLSVHYRATSRSRHYQAGRGRPALEQIGGKRFPPNPFGSLRVWGDVTNRLPRVRRRGTDLEEGNSATTTVGTAFPPQVFLPSSVRKRNKNPNFTRETLRAINCYRAVRVNFITVGSGQSSWPTAGG